MGAQLGEEHGISAVEAPKLSSKAQAELERQTRDAISDRATISFIRRTLCAHNTLASTIAGGDKSRNTPQPIEELLPPLTSSNEVDLQLYAIIAVIFKEFVFTWYSKITPDHVFPEEIIQIIAHCTRALEQRLRKVDLEALLLDEIPDVLETHVHAYRISNTTSGRNALASSRRQIYHTLNPHPALSPVPVESDPSTILEQRQNETAWRQLLVQGVLAVLLPTEDLENGCLRALVAEIFSEMILGGGISDKACEGWLLWEGITKVVEVVKPRNLQQSNPPDAPSRQALDRIDLLGQESTTSKEMAEGRTSNLYKTSHAASSVRISSLFWLVLQYIFLAWYTIRSIIITIATSSSLPSRSGAAGSVPAPIDDGRLTVSPDVGHDTSAEPGRSMKRPVMSMRAWNCISTVIELDGRMPWLSGIASFLHWIALTGPGRVGETDGALDR